MIQRVCNEAGISYNPDTQYILWYVQKYQGLGARALDEETGIISGTNGDGWHVDGVLLDRAKVAISYDANVPTGVTEIPEIPVGYEVDRGTVVTVGQTGGVGGSMDRANPSIPGYVFQGWNTSSDGTGTTYANGETIPLYENMTLYAMWSKGGNTLSLTKVDGLGNTVSGASFTISDGSNTTEFNAGTYRNNEIQTDTVYTITETSAPENYEGLDESFNFIVSSQGGTGLTAYFCDTEGNQVEAPDGVSLTYTNGLTNIRVTNIGYFYVYHSSDQSVDTYPVNGTFDITALVADGYLYGGYYSDYKKAGTYAGGPYATYDGTSYAGAITGYWDGSAAYTENGMSMTPVAGRTYYLKEVPDEYFMPYMAVVYDSYADPNTAEDMYLISATDDKNYQDFGLLAENTYTQEKEFALRKLYYSIDAIKRIYIGKRFWTHFNFVTSDKQIYIENKKRLYIMQEPEKGCEKERYNLFIQFIQKLSELINIDIKVYMSGACDCSEYRHGTDHPTYDTQNHIYEFNPKQYYLTRSFEKIENISINKNLIEITYSGKSLTKDCDFE